MRMGRCRDKVRPLRKGRPMIKMYFALSLGFGGLILAVQASHAAPQCDLSAGLALAVPYATFSTILPICPALSMRRWASGACDRENSLSITGSSAPRAIIGQTWASISAA